jgi:hypothetical protein
VRVEDLQQGSRVHDDPLRQRRALRWDLVLLGVLSAFGPLSMDLYLPALRRWRASSAQARRRSS